MGNLSQDSLVTLLICSDLGMDSVSKKKYKPYTTVQWNKLVEKMLNSSLQKPSMLLNAQKETVTKELNLSDDEFLRIEFLLRRGGNIAMEIERLESKGINITTRADEKYPQRLKKVLKKYAPPVVFFSGSLKLLNEKGIGVVGSRDVGEEGVLFTRKLASKCVKDSCIVVSGGARGVDSIAEKTSLENGGSAISFVADSLSKKVKDMEVRNAILKGKYLVLSAVNPDGRFMAYSAMDRNKYIYALSQYVVAVSSSDNKGGTWAGAVENLNKRWVPLFVRDGERVPLGNKKLIKLGGKPMHISVLESNEMSIEKWCEESKGVECLNDNCKQITISSLMGENVNEYKIK